MYHNIVVHMDILKRIIQLRDERNWTNYRLSDEAGLPYVTLTNMFSRGTQPSIATLTALCEAFGISLSQFFSEENDEILLSDEEKELVLSFRTLSKKCKYAVKNLIIELKD